MFLRPYSVPPAVTFLAKALRTPLVVFSSEMGLAPGRLHAANGGAAVSKCSGHTSNQQGWCVWQEVLVSVAASVAIRNFPARDLGLNR